MHLLKEYDRRNRTRMLYSFYPDEGPLRRDLYKKHTAFFAAGADHRERCIMAANRIGKSLGVGGYETALHLTGLYPEWWTGRRFDHPVEAWACGDTTQTVRDINQRILLGPSDEPGTGLIPFDNIVDIKAKAGSIPDAVETVTVKHHLTGDLSELTFKTYDQKRKAFQGTAKHVIWLDEEPPMPVYSECLLRTMTTDGLILLTFTPLIGLSEVVLSFMPGGKLPKEQKASKFVIQATWDDAPHLTERQKVEIIASTPAYQQDARSKGVPMLGAGAIYPISEDDITIDDFELPKHFPRGYGLDVGWNATAAVWGAWDREQDIVYIYSVYKRGQAEPPVHAAAIKARGLWIPGVIDPASRGRSQRDGEKLIEEYRNDLGLDIIEADNAREAGILKVWNRLSTGRMKIFKSCRQWFEEYRIYRRDENGKVIKQFDHLMDGTRYLIMSGLERASFPKPASSHFTPRRGG